MSEIRMTYEYIQVPYGSDEIRVHMGGIRMISSTYERHADNKRVHSRDIQMRHDYKRLIYG